MFQQRLLKVIGGIQDADDELYAELREVRKNKTYQEEAKKINIPAAGSSELGFELAGPAGMGSDLGQETIVLRVGRPVLEVSGDEAVLEFRDAESEVWRKRLRDVRENLAKAARAVGRIDLLFDIDFTWVGTGWLIDTDILVTNRHVAKLFSERQDGKFVFSAGTGGQTKQVSIDFLQEAGKAEKSVFQIIDVLYIEDDKGADIAFLSIEPNDRVIPDYIQLAPVPAVDKQQVAVIGYPARDPNFPELQLLLDIFGNMYDKKRLAPGVITGRTGTDLFHDCSTLGGNSGSVVLDLQTGAALGLHYAGSFLERNYAVPAQVILDRLNRVKNKISADTPFVPNDHHIKPIAMPPTDPKQTQSGMTFNIPLQLNIAVTITGSIANATTIQQVPLVLSGLPGEEPEAFITEGKPADYSGRDGFVRSFLGDDFLVELPGFTDTNTADRLTFEEDGKQAYELKYRHFSVVMSKSRRQCFFSAVNIDGKTSVPMARGPWRLDPRIPQDAQIMKECYGSAPKFSRGHMTRREDPIWGSPDEAVQGNADSMHVTNTVPQMQTLNAGVWLALENYALQNARKDDMRISVITGPVFAPSDPTRYGVVIPLGFWKVIVFIHDETKQLTATGYMMSQTDYLAKTNEMVYGAHKTDQVAISEIAAKTQLDFGKLVAIDPLNKKTEAAGGVSTAKRIENLAQIIF